MKFGHWGLVALALAIAVANSCGGEQAPAAPATTDTQTDLSNVDSDLEVSSAKLGAQCTAVQDCVKGEGSAGICKAWHCSAGVCKIELAGVGSGCDPSSLCAIASCDAAGSCKVIGAKVCPSGVCTVGMCESASGNCTLAKVAVGVACDDGDACTLGDSCNNAGGCVAGTVVQCAGTTCAPAACAAESGACASKSAVIGTACEDGNPCTISDVCDGKGGCNGGSKFFCPSGSCYDGACDAKTGGCVALAKSDTTACDDGQKCTDGDHCSGGNCSSGAWVCPCKVDIDCDDGNVCTKDACETGACSQLPTAATPCDDDNACSLKDACAGGKCVASSAVACDDANACTADSCAPATGVCAHQALAGAACDDGNACTVGDLCVAGDCVSAGAKICPAATACQKSTCDPVNGACGFAFVDGACQGADACLVGQTCAAGQCQGGVQVLCDDANACTADQCDAKSGLCVFAAKPDGAVCGTNQLCTGGKCACALGAYGSGANGSESFVQISALPAGFVAVGTSFAATGDRGLLAVVSLANKVTVLRHCGGNGAPALAFAGVVASAKGFRIAATSAAASCVAIDVDEQGNALAQYPVAVDAAAESVTAVAADAVFVATQAWGAGKSTVVARLSPDGQLLWTAKIAPGSPDDAARGRGAVVWVADLLVFGQDVHFASPNLSAGWVARLQQIDGKQLWKQAIAPMDQGSLLAGGALQNGKMWLVGQKQKQSLDGFDSAWLFSLDPTKPIEIKAIVTGWNGAALTGVSGKDGKVVAVGWVGGKTLDAAAVAVENGQMKWTQTYAVPGQQSLASVALLADGTFAAVGTRATATGSEAYWVRLAEDGTVGCE